MWPNLFYPVGLCAALSNSLEMMLSQCGWSSSECLISDSQLVPCALQWPLLTLVLALSMVKNPSCPNTCCHWNVFESNIWTSTVVLHHFNDLDSVIFTLISLVLKSLISFLSVAFIFIALFLLPICLLSLYHRRQWSSAFQVDTTPTDQLAYLNTNLGGSFFNLHWVNIKMSPSI